jgi:thiol:disulfide interchange protein DsbC
MASLVLASPTFALAGSASASWDRFAPFVFGKGSDEIVVFTAPSCPYCRQLIDHVPHLTERYRVVLLPISFTTYDAQRVRALACAKDQGAAAQALLLHQDVILPQMEPCDLAPVAARFVEAERRRITGVPFIIRSDGAVSRGLRPDLDAWLARGAER